MIWVFGALALVLGIWLGMPGDRHTSERESREALEKGIPIRRPTRRRVMWLDYLFRGKKKSEVRERARMKSQRKPFKLDR